MDSGQPSQERQLACVDAIAEDLSKHLFDSIAIMREFGTPDPTYIASAAVMAVLMHTLYAFFINDGMSEKDAEARARDLLKPVSNAADTSYWSAKEKHRSRSRIPPVSMN